MNGRVTDDWLWQKSQEDSGAEVSPFPGTRAGESFWPLCAAILLLFR